MVGAMGGLGPAQQFGQAFDGAAVADGQGQRQSPEVAIAVVGEVVAAGGEKILALAGHFADPKHAAFPSVRLGNYNTYRQEKPFFIDHRTGGIHGNRSV